MKRNKKAFLIVVVAVVAVFLVCTIATTYAWFLSRYSRDYEFVLESDSHAIIKYESDLTYASGTISTPANVLIPATAKTLTGINQQALGSLDMFDADTVAPAHTGAVKTSAQEVRFSAKGAYWAGESASAGQFRPEVRAFLSSFATAQSLSESTLISDVNAGVKPLAANELVEQGEVDYFMILAYANEKILYYHGAFYIGVAQAEATFTLPAEAESTDRYWKALTTSDQLSGEDILEITDGKQYLLLQPNTTFTFTLSVFMAKTDEELAISVNGERITFFTTLKIL